MASFKKEKDVFIIIQNELGNKKIINTQDIDFIDGTNEKTSVLYLKTHLDFPIRIRLSLGDMLKVVNGEVEFFDVFSEVVEVINGVAGVAKQDTSNSMSDSGFLKVEESKPEDLEQIKKEFSSGLVGSMGKGESIKPKPDLMTMNIGEIPSFSKKYKKELITKVESKKESVW